MCNANGVVEEAWWFVIERTYPHDAKAEAFDLRRRSAESAMEKKASSSGKNNLPVSPRRQPRGRVCLT